MYKYMQTLNGKERVNLDLSGKLDSIKDAINGKTKIELARDKKYEQRWVWYSVSYNLWDPWIFWLEITNQHIPSIPRSAAWV